MPSPRLDKTQLAYKALYQRLNNADLFKDGPNRPLDLRLATTEAVKDAVRKSAGKLPGIYLDSYVWPLLRNLEWILQRSKESLKLPGQKEPVPLVASETIATLVEAITNHCDATGEEAQCLRGLVAIISRVYSSFLEPEPGTKRTIPTPEKPIPPLATFRTKLDPDNGDAVPYVLKATEVKRLCGGDVGIVSIPWIYLRHPALCWPALAHEAGGHDILQAYPGLLWELRQQVRRRFYGGADPREDTPNSKKEFLGLLWQYWAEEAACDVCAILNVGPSYAKCLAVYFGALNDRFRRWSIAARMGVSPPPNPSPHLHVSWPPSAWPDKIRTDKKTDVLRPHPTDLCKFHVMLGAIDTLSSLDKKVRRRHVDDILACLELAVSAAPPDDKTVRISGWIPFKTGRWILLDENEISISRKEMEACAQDVGRTIAATKFQALKGNSLQNLETWDQSDEHSAQQVCEHLLKDTNGAEDERELVEAVEAAGDDANLLAGAIEALFREPSQYEMVNARLVKALQTSFAGDEYWGTGQWHPLAGLPRVTGGPMSLSASGIR